MNKLSLSDAALLRIFADQFKKLSDAVNDEDDASAMAPSDEVARKVSDLAVAAECLFADRAPTTVTLQWMLDSLDALSEALAPVHLISEWHWRLETIRLHLVRTLVTA